MVTHFPVGNDLIHVSFELFRGTTRSLLELAPLVFIVRIIVIKFTLGGSREYGTLLKELVYLYVGFFVFQEVMEVVMQAPRLAENIIKVPDSSPVLEIAQKKWLGFYYMGLGAEQVISIVSSIVYWTVCFLYVVLMALMITIGGYIIFFSTLFRMSWMIKAYMSLILILSMWPFVWYSVDQAFIFAVKSLVNSGSTMSAIIAAIFGGILKLSVPVIGVLAAMKAPVALGAGLFAKAAIGAKPLAVAASLAHKGVQSTSRGIGLPQAIESFRRPVSIEQIERKREQERFRISDIAPRAAYGIHKIKGSINSEKNFKESFQGNTYSSTQNYQEFKSQAQTNHQLRKTVNNRHQLVGKSEKNLSAQRQSTLKSSADQKINVETLSSMKSERLDYEKSQVHKHSHTESKTHRKESTQHITTAARKERRFSRDNEELSK